MVVNDTLNNIVFHIVRRGPDDQGIFQYRRYNDLSKVSGQTFYSKNKNK